jgi:ribosomal protein S18 acetylase RimI-like enzyme
MGDAEALDFYRIVTAPSWTSEPGTEILDLRHFPSASLRPLLEEEAQVWTRLLAWDYNGSIDMILRYVEAKILPGYVALQGGRPVGYCFFVYEGSKGVLGDLYVSQTHARDRQIEWQLLTHGINTLQHSPGVQRVEAQLLLHPTGAIAPPFVAEGFRQFPRLFMEQPLSAPKRSRRALTAPFFGDRSPLPASSDLEVRRWSDQDYSAAAAVITAAYQGHVDGEINDQYRSIPGSLRFLNNIVRFPGCGVFDGSASFVAIHRPTHAMVGLILCSRVKDDIGHVTQVCVVPEQRGSGLGEMLLSLTAAELRRRSFSALTLTVTEANRGAVALYERLGFTVQRVFDAFVWER